MTDTTTEPRGYLACLVIEDGMVRLLAPDTALAPGADAGTDLTLGRVGRRRGQPEGWGYTMLEHQDPSVDGSRLYVSEIAAAQACAIQRLEGLEARMQFDAAEALPIPMPPRRTSPPAPEG